MEETSTDNIPSNTASEHLATENITVDTFYPKYAQTEITHDHFRFAYDLCELVLDIRRELKPNVPHNLPDPPNYLFTQEHAHIVMSLLGTDTTNLNQKIHVISKGNYDAKTYLMCRNFFVVEWKNRAYTEKSFICACASIAYVAAHFIQASYHCGALDDVVVFIANWIGDILIRGTIDNSCWGEFGSYIYHTTTSTIS